MSRKLIEVSDKMFVFEGRVDTAPQHFSTQLNARKLVADLQIREVS